MMPWHKWVRLAERGHAIRALMAAALSVHFVLCAIIAFQYSPNPDEMAHVAGGLAIWQHRRFDLYCVNPPLARMIASLPAYWIDNRGGATLPEYKLTDRHEFTAGRQLIESYPNRWRVMLIGGRLLLIPFTLIGGIVCYIWAKQYYGPMAGLLAIWMWCFSPDLLTWDSLIGADGLAASMGICAAYLFVRWLDTPNWYNAILAGSALGLALLSKFTLAIYLPLWPLLWLVFHRLGLSHKANRSRQLLHLAFVLGLSLYIVNVFYLFTGSFQAIGQYKFVSQLLADKTRPDDDEKPSNRFAYTVLKHIYVPFPKDFVAGIDLQQKDFEDGKPSYLLGRWSDHGWWYYYLIGMVVKFPLGTLLLFIFATAISLLNIINSIRSTSSGNHRDYLHYICFLFCTAIFICVSSQTGFSLHFRYILPSIPFMIVWASQLAVHINHRRLIRSLLVLIPFGWAVASSLGAFPHSMSYFNEFVGTRHEGSKILLGSGFSWGQNCFYLRSWIERNCGSSVPFVSVSSVVPSSYLGIQSRGRSPSLEVHAEDGRLQGPVPGWHLVDIESILDPKLGLAYFSSIQPDAYIADTIAAYHLDIGKTNELRSRLGLELLPTRSVSRDAFLLRLSTDARRDFITQIAYVCLPIQQTESLTVPDSLIACHPHARWVPVDADMIRSGVLKKYDLVIVPGGRASLQSAALGEQGRQSIIDFIQGGGGYIGICAGAFLGSSEFDWGLSLVNIACQDGTLFVPSYGNQSWMARGGGAVRFALTDEGSQILGRIASPGEVDFTGGPIFLPGRRTFMPEYVVLAEYETEVYYFEFQKGNMVGTPMIVAAPFGRGKVVLIGSHIETSGEYPNIVKRIINAAAR